MAAADPTGDVLAMREQQLALGVREVSDSIGERAMCPSFYARPHGTGEVAMERTPGSPCSESLVCTSGVRAVAWGAVVVVRLHVAEWGEG